jgi:hypothetical protein
VNRELATKVADAVLYEGYMLYPYRASSIKNQQRWSFGILYPPAFEEVRQGTERSRMHSQCLLKLSGGAVVHVHLRFLQLCAQPMENRRRSSDSPDEGVSRSFEFDVSPADELQQFFQFGFDRIEQPASPPKVAQFPSALSQDEVQGSVLVSFELLRPDVMKMSIDVANTTSLPSNATARDSVLRSSLLSAHTILSVTGGEFVSLLDPPEDLREEIKACKNIGNFPVLVGTEGERDMLLCSPIILYDYPQIAPESAGDFYDATEMDEMLTLRVMTLSDCEKSEIRVGDDRVRSLLQRTEESAREQLTKTHGAIRSMRPASGQ